MLQHSAIQSLIQMYYILEVVSNRKLIVPGFSEHPVTGWASTAQLYCTLSRYCIKQLRF